HAFYTYAFPVLPWLSANLAATAFGEHLGQLFARGKLALVQRRLNLASAAAFASATALKASFVGARLMLHTGLFLATFRTLSSPLQKQPPSPDYFLFYGAFGLATLSIALLCERKHVGQRVLAYAAAFGQCSLFIYLTHWFLLLLILFP